MIAKFQKAFVAAFEYHRREFVWTNDGVLRTTVMQSYIYPFIAKSLNLYLVCNLPADASFFSHQAVKECLTYGKGYPQEPIVVLEHENNAAESVKKEMSDLVRWKSPFNILITYPAQKDFTQQLLWLSEHFKPKLMPLGNNANEYLCILPSAGNGNRDTPFSDWWNYFAWNKSTLSFL